MPLPLLLKTLSLQTSCDGPTGAFARYVPNRQEGAAFCGLAQQILQSADFYGRSSSPLIKGGCGGQAGSMTAKSRSIGRMGRQRALFLSFPGVEVVSGRLLRVMGGEW
jgi:hypothetical protein